MHCLGGEFEGLLRGLRVELHRLKVAQPVHVSFEGNLRHTQFFFIPEFSRSAGNARFARVT